MSVYRHMVLGASALPPVERLARRHGYALAARRFVAGESIETALPALQSLLAQGRGLVVDVLGEYVRDTAAATAMRDTLSHAISTLSQAGIAPVISIKPTQIGLLLDASLASEYAVNLCLEAERAGGRVCFDMEDHRTVDATLAMLRDAHAAGATRTSTVFQAYLHRANADLQACLAALPSMGELRVVKGAYREPAAVVSHSLGEIRERFVALCDAAWQAGRKVNVASHDQHLLQAAIARAQALSVPPERMELQMLYGVRPALQARLQAEGHAVRVYVPVGADWYGYFSRRLAERPENLWLVLRGLFG